MKLRDAAIRMILDDWVAGSRGEAYAIRYTSMTYWYGRSIYVVAGDWDRDGINFSGRNTGIGLPAYWPDPHRLSADNLRQLDADIAAARHEEIVGILIAFKNEVVAK